MSFTYGGICDTITIKENKNSYRRKTSDQIRIVYKTLGTVIPLPCHGKNVKEAYIVELKELFSEIESKGGDEND